MMNNKIIGTFDNLIMYFSNPKFACPVNSLYGSKVKGFIASNIHFFEGKPWQLRSVRVGNDWFVLPFLIHTCGVPWNYPIISRQAMDKIGLRMIDKTTLSSLEDHKDILFMPTPLGPIPTPLCCDWGNQWKKKIQHDDVRFNLVGHELAVSISAIGVQVCGLEDENSAKYRKHFIDTLIRDFKEKGVAALPVYEAIEAEIDAISASRKSGKSWTSKTLPFDSSVFVNLQN
jgi:hypothetical protein